MSAIVLDRRFGSLAAAPAVAGATVMGTGILSVDFDQIGFVWLSRVLLVLTAAVWIVLACGFIIRRHADPEAWRSDSRRPAAMTAVAATGVLGTRLSLAGWHWPAGVLLVLALALWVLLLPRVLRHWVTPTVGASFLVTVGTQSLSVLSATLATVPGGRWLRVPATVFFVAGLGLYVLVAARFDVRQVVVGAGDHWVLPGALAISALAGAKVTLVAGSARDLMLAVDWPLFALVLLGYLVLATAEVLRPRLGYDLRRWSTVFPLGMTGTACLWMAHVTHLGWPRTLAEVLVWPALTVWLLTAYGTLNHLWRHRGAR